MTAPWLSDTVWCMSGRVPIAVVRTELGTVAATSLLQARQSVVALQVAHKAVDPLDLQHSWRLATRFVEQEVQAVRAADPSRPVVLNGFLAGSLPVWAHQWWRTLDQANSFAVARRLTDVVALTTTQGTRASAPATGRSTSPTGPNGD